LKRKSLIARGFRFSFGPRSWPSPSRFIQRRSYDRRGACDERWSWRHCFNEASSGWMRKASA